MKARKRTTPKKSTKAPKKLTLAELEHRITAVRDNLRVLCAWNVEIFGQHNLDYFYEITKFRGEGE